VTTPHYLLSSIAIGMLYAPAPVLAHHGAQVRYDASKPVEIKGIVKTIEWQNPHAGFTLVVEDQSGKVSTWEFELAGTTNLLRRNWTKNSLRVGDAVSVKAFVARDGSPFANAIDITINDGRPLFGGSPGVYEPRKSQK
jgi:hypothetical protein